MMYRDQMFESRSPIEGYALGIVLTIVATVVAVLLGIGQ